MSKLQNSYDIYVSYPPGVDKERVNASIRANLSEKEAEDLIQSLAEHPQSIIAEHCTREERENAQHYFSYMGLDVITRVSMELTPQEVKEREEESEGSHDFLSDPVPQCPVCYTIIEDPAAKECPSCGLHFATATDALVHRKRIEWQEKIAFESRKQHEIAYKILREKQEEEKRLRKQIRAELEANLQAELGRNSWRSWFRGKKAVLLVFIIVLLVLSLLGAGYFIAQLIH